MGYAGRKGADMHYINEIREGDNVSDIYLCKSKIIAKTKAGKTYYYRSRAFRSVSGKDFYGKYCDIASIKSKY